MRRLIAVAAYALAALAVSAPVALAHQGNPNYRSVIDALTPKLAGISLDILNFDDRLSLTNRSSEPITVEGYNSEPYVRILPDGTVQVNRLSPATYLNADRSGTASTPSFATAKAAIANPEWQTVDKTGHYEWHDHRIHWMAKSMPPQVKDKKVKTKVYDWKVPVKVGSRTGAINGTLFWEPRDDSGLPIWAIVLLVAGVAGGGFAMIRVRHRRDAAADADSGDGDGDGPVEAW